MDVMLGLFLLAVYVAWPTVLVVAALAVIVFLALRSQAERALAEFQAMTPAQQLALLMKLDAEGRWERVDRYVSRAPARLTESLMNYGARQGLDTSFLVPYLD